jgi:hypothetical protein
MRAFFEMLFDQQESTCFAENPKGTRVQSITHFNAGSHAFFSINPLDPHKDRVPLESYHHARRPRRADHNVVIFRNILIEMDKSPLSEQWAFIAKIELPFTSCVYSGGKSYHFIVSLQEPCPNRESYDTLVRRIYHVLGARIDPACKNPSRLSRAPGFYREETGKFQNLNDLRQRVSMGELETWLLSHGSKSEVVTQTPSSSARANVSGALYASTERFLCEGAAEGLWNHTLFKAACDAFAKGWSQKDFCDRAAGITGHLDAKDLSTIRSAWLRTGGILRQG